MGKSRDIYGGVYTGCLKGRDIPVVSTQGVGKSRDILVDVYTECRER